MSEPVTIIVRRKVKPGREAEYEAWLTRMTEGAKANFPGYLGVGLQRPTEDGEAYRSVFRFDTIEHLEAFERSEFRAQMLAEGAELFASDAAWDRYTGLEFWFNPPTGTKIPQPSPHRMAIVMIAVIFSLVMIVNASVGPLMDDWPLALRVFITVILQVSLMTYVIMPRLTPLISRFIYPKTRTL
ncbi:MAG: antibiotic biosynthesis monooxygenase [Pseudomonadota bacterium]